jgi:DNA-cytosine methyltransferase
MNVLSLFDGMSCGRIALDRAGISVTSYHASELDKYAIQVTQANWPETVQLGDVTKWREWDINWGSIDLLIGGSPCQGFSFAGKQLAFDDPRSKLFFVYVDILNHIKKLNPGVKFMLENVRMKKEYLAIISEQLGVEPVFINSALVSAQNRQRYYWANWEFGQPKDKELTIESILEDGIIDKDKSFCIDDNYFKEGNLKSYFEKHRRQLVFQINSSKESAGKQPYNQNRVYYKKGKSVALTASFADRTNAGDELGYRKLTPIECERLQTVPDNYTNHISNTQRYKMLGNGWTVDVIAHIFKSIGNK